MTNPIEQYIQIQRLIEGNWVFVYKQFAMTENQQAHAKLSELRKNGTGIDAKYRLVSIAVTLLSEETVSG